MVDLASGNIVNPLEQFVLLAKNAKGAAAVELIKQALEAPGVYVFGELLDMSNIQVGIIRFSVDLDNDNNLQDLTNGPSSSYLTLLNIFAFGNYKSLLECTEPLPEVTETMRRKLRLLTVVSLAEQNKMLAYNLLMSELDINTVRELEDLVIEGISGENNNGVKSKLIKIAFFSAGVIQGKLDQKSSHFEVDYVIGRDIRWIFE